MSKFYFCFIVYALTMNRNLIIEDSDTFES